MVNCEPCMIRNKIRKAKYRCKVCVEIYCSQCKLDHSKFRAFKDHEIQSLRNYIDCEVEHVTPTIDEHEGHAVNTYASVSCRKENFLDEQEDVDDEDHLIAINTQPPKQDSGKRGHHVFPVEVNDTDLARKIGIRGRDCSFEVHGDFVALKHGGVTFTCKLSAVRRFTVKRNQMHIEVGRKCDFGEGNLYMNCIDVVALRNALETAISLK